MKVGDIVRATWYDGYEVVGKYLENKQGYIIIVQEDDKKTLVACDKNAVTFEVITATE